MMIPTAISITLPRMANALNSFMMFMDLFLLFTKSMPCFRRSANIYLVEANQAIVYGTIRGFEHVPFTRH
jgi:hypothetical protein